jgi:hypothetical protein
MPIHLCPSMACALAGHRLPPVPVLPRGKADWIWDEEMNLHIPCCSRWRTDGTGRVVKCQNGPLNESEIADGTCTDSPHVDPLRG